MEKEKFIPDHSNLDNITKPEGISSGVFGHALGLLRQVNRYQQVPEWGSRRASREQTISEGLDRIRRRVEEGVLPHEALQIVQIGFDVCGYEAENPDNKPGGWSE